MKLKKKKNRRSDHKIVTKEGKVLKYLRESRKLSMRSAGKILGSSDAIINHSENGRLDLTPSLIMKLLNAYGYEWGYFQKLVKGEIDIPENEFDECVQILKRMKPEKLKIVKNILSSF
jgi:transcriptional regulator with XRE-family HTH domain